MPCSRPTKQYLTYNKYMTCTHRRSDVELFPSIQVEDYGIDRSQGQRISTESNGLVRPKALHEITLGAHPPHAA